MLSRATRQANWKAACSKQTEHMKQQQKNKFLSVPRGNPVPSNVYQQGTVDGGSEQPGNKAGKKLQLLLGLRNTVVTTWASRSKN